jgi:hypothetical protein
MVILTVNLCHNLGTYHGMAVNYHGKMFITLAHGSKLKYGGNLLQNFKPRKCKYCIKLLRYFYNIRHRSQSHTKVGANVLTLFAIYII